MFKRIAYSFPTVSYFHQRLEEEVVNRAYGFPMAAATAQRKKRMRFTSVQLKFFLKLQDYSRWTSGGVVS